MNFDKPPKDASVDNLLELCEVLREGVQSRDGLYEAVEQSHTLVRSNIKYGVGLGFLKELEDGVETTPRGVEASYNQDNPEELAEQFREGLQEYQLYTAVIEQLASEDEPPIIKSDVLRVFRTSVGLEGSENTLGDAATTFIQTLEAAGLGKYVVGRGGNETRLEIAEDFERLVDKITATPEPEPASVEDRVKSTPQLTVKENSQPRVDSSSSPIRINIELSGDEDPDKVEDLIIGVRRGLTRDLGNSDDSKSSEHSEKENLEEASDNSEAGTVDQDKKNNPERNDEAESTSSDQSLDTFVESKSTSKDEK